MQLEHADQKLPRRNKISSDFKTMNHWILEILNAKKKNKLKEISSCFMWGEYLNGGIEQTCW